MIPKFRAWQKPIERMREVTTLEFTGGDLKYIYFDDEKLGYLPFDVVLMQSTGLFDSAGTDIFDEDVISWEYYDEFRDEGKARVVFRDGMFKLLDLSGGKEAWDSLQDCVNECSTFVVGNIYENKELVEVANDTEV